MEVAHLRENNFDTFHYVAEDFVTNLFCERPMEPAGAEQEYVGHGLV